MFPRRIKFLNSRKKYSILFNVLTLRIGRRYAFAETGMRGLIYIKKYLQSKQPTSLLALFMG
jgi:hypothetical protein